MKVFTLYVGTGGPGAKEKLLEILRERFDSFTVISGEGYFRGTPEPMWFVRLAADEPERIFEVAGVIRSALEQDSVGIEYQSQFDRCTKTECAPALRRLLD